MEDKKEDLIDYSKPIENVRAEAFLGKKNRAQEILINYMETIHLPQLVNYMETIHLPQLVKDNSYSILFKCIDKIKKDLNND